MERFTVFLGDQLHVQQLFLQDKANLGSDTEVGRCYKYNFLKHRVFSELMSIFEFCIELLFFHHIEVHHISNIKVENPVLAIFHAKCVAHIQLESLILFNVNQLLQSCERNLQTLSTITKVKLAVLFDHFLVTIDG